MSSEIPVIQLSLHTNACTLAATLTLAGLVACDGSADASSPEQTENSGPAGQESVPSNGEEGASGGRDSSGGEQGQKDPDDDSPDGHSESEGEEDDNEEDGVTANPDADSMSLCDIWKQDCPTGEKCMPYDDTGGNTWSALKCVAVSESPQKVGEPCDAPSGGSAGIDNCEAGSMCYYVDPSTNKGTCVNFCTGSPDVPICAEDHICSVSNKGVLVLCRPTCNPLNSNDGNSELIPNADCSDYPNSSCLPATGTEEFVCIIDASGREARNPENPDMPIDPGAFGDPCDCLNCCNPGLLCVPAEEMPNCEAEGCCTSWCETEPAAPEAPDGGNRGEQKNCPSEDFECVPYFDSPPPQYEHLGSCRLSEY